ncbi:MAG: hypothetical protein KBT19_06655 [Lachnospiraceae bacterium]|nr:hypothetical protein [Candidatus Colinaster equi]
MKRFLAIALVIVVVCSMASIGLANGADKTWDLEGTMFPLAEPATITVLTAGYRSADFNNLETSKDFQSLCEALNVKFDFVYLGGYDEPTTRDNLQTRLMSGDYGEAIWSFYVDTLNTADIEELATAGMIIPLNQYMTDEKIMPNFYKNIYSTHENIYNNMKSNDGNVYYFAGCSEINAYTADEGLMQVNSEWLAAWKAARGIDHSPATLAEFEDMLAFFHDADLNGNGAADEIPYFIAQGTYAGCMTLEHAMGMYGIATKDSAADMDIMIDDNGKCDFVYTTDTYKAALKQFADWYAKGYVWEEAFTGNAETITNIVASAKDNVGLFNVCENIVGFEPMLPPAIEGYTAKYHMHPSVRLGVRQPQAVITDKCKNPEIFAGLMDVLFNFDNYVFWNEGSVAFDAGRLSIVDGKYVYDNNVKIEYTPENTPLSSYMCRMEVDTLDNYNQFVDIDSYYGEQARVKGYVMYDEAGIWNPTKNLWPRCSIISESADDYAFAYTDVSIALAEYRAKFVTGELDIDAEWDNFQTKLQELGVNDMRDIIQASYEAFCNKN